MVASATPAAQGAVPRRDRGGLVAAAGLAALAVAFFSVGFISTFPSGTLPGGESWSPRLGASVAAAVTTGEDSTVVDLAVAPDGGPIYALQAPGIVAYDAEDLSRVGAINLAPLNAANPLAMTVSSDGSAALVLEDDATITLVSLRPGSFGEVVAPPTFVSLVRHWDPSASHRWSTVTPRWRPLLAVAPDASAAYVVDDSEGRLCSYPVGASGFGEPVCVALGAPPGDSPRATLTVNPESGLIYLVDEAGTLRVYEPGGLTEVGGSVLGESTWRIDAFSDDGSLFYDFVVRLPPNGAAFYLDHAVYWSEGDAIAYESGVTLRDDGTLIHRDGCLEYAPNLADNPGDVLSVRALDTSRRRAGNVRIAAPPRAPLFVPTATPGLVLTNAEGGGVALVDVGSGVTVAGFGAMSPDWRWGAGVDFHHLYYVDAADDPKTIHRFDVSAASPPSLFYWGVAAATFLLATVVGALVAARARWQPRWRRFIDRIAKLSEIRRVFRRRPRDRAPTRAGEYAKIAGVAAAGLTVLPALAWFGVSVSVAWWRIGLAVLLAVVSAVGLRWPIAAVALGGGGVWLASEQFHAAAVALMAVALALAAMSVAVTPARRPSYRRHDPRRMHVLTLAAVFFLWIPLVNIMLAFGESLRVIDGDDVNRRPASALIVSSLALTVGLLIWFGALYGSVSGFR